MKGAFSKGAANGRALRVCHLSTFAGQNGAGLAALRLHRSLLTLDIASSLVCRHGDMNEPGVQCVGDLRSILGRLLTKCRRMWLCHQLNRMGANKTDRFPLFSDTRSPETITLGQLPKCDVLHVHWISGITQWMVSAIVDQWAFFQDLPADLPVVWTFHDNNPFTGGCHYFMDCNRYESECRGCPQLKGFSAPSDAFASCIQREKRRIFEILSHHAFAVAANSQWTADRARASSVLRGLSLDVEVMYPGVDTAIFCPLDKIACRDRLGIAQDALVVCFGAASLNDPIKGVDLILKALPRSRFSKHIHLLTFGKGGQLAASGFAVTHVGEVTSDADLAQVYGAADVFIMASKAESFGQTAAEALACGIPIVGTPVGGIPEVVEHRFNGLLATSVTAESIRDALDELLDDPKRRQEMSANARQSAISKFDSTKQALGFLSLYRRLIGKAAGQPETRQL